MTRAAEAEHVSQPSVSQAVRELEAELGTALFHRVGRRVVLTAAGEALVEPARQVLRDVETGRAAVEAVAGLGGRAARPGRTPHARGRPGRAPGGRLPGRVPRHRHRARRPRGRVCARRPGGERRVRARDHRRTRHRPGPHQPRARAPGPVGGPAAGHEGIPHPGRGHPGPLPVGHRAAWHDHAHAARRGVRRRATSARASRW